MPYCSYREVREAADGNWLVILDSLAPDLSLAIERAPRHVPCPVNGGTDGFRLFNDVDVTGGGISNLHGPFKTGFSLLQWVNSWDFETTKYEVGRFMGCQVYLTQEEREQERAEQQAKATMEEVVPQAAGGAVGGYMPAFDTSWRKDLPEFSAKRPRSKQPGERNVSATSQATDDSVAKAAAPVGDAPVATPASNVRPIRSPAPAHAANSERGMKLEERRRQLAQQREMSTAKADSKITSVWSASVKMGDYGSNPALTYLRSRKVAVRGQAVMDAETVRFHPALQYWSEDAEGNLVDNGTHPGFVAAVRDAEGNLVTLHRTFLTRTGKKLTKFGPARKMMTVPESRGSASGGAIRLGEPADGVLGVAEGLETALSAYRASGIPCWSTISATMLEKVVVPDDVHTVLIWADRDRSGTGEASARALSERLTAQGVKCHILMPAMPIKARSKGVDWNDVMMTQGVLGFPRVQALLRKTA